MEKYYKYILLTTEFTPDDVETAEESAEEVCPGAMEETWEIDL